MSTVHLLAALAGSALACRPAPPCAPVPVETVPVELIAAVDANGRSPGDASPTELRLYLLRGRAGLERSTYEQVRRQAPAEVLGEAPLADRVVVLYPDETRTLALPAAPEARFVAVVALVREPSGAAWRASAPLPAAEVCGRASGFTVRLRGMHVELSARRSAAAHSPGPTRPARPAVDPLRALDVAPEREPPATPPRAAAQTPSMRTPK